MRDQVIDRVRGLATTESPTDPLPAPELGHPYVPSDWRALGQILPARLVSPADVFLEVGCGKGRVLVAALRYSFRRVIGIELSPDLAAIAAANLRRMGKDGARATIVAADASTTAVADDVTFIYLFNPFAGAIFEAFLQRVSESISRRPRRIRILYLQPLMHESLIGAGYVLEDAPRSELRRYVSAVVHE